MAGSTGTRVLWAGLLLPPVLVLTAAAAASFWPERVVAMMAAARRAWSAEPTPVGPASRARFEFVRVPPPFEPPRPAVMLKGTIRTPDGAPFRGSYSLSAARARTWRHTAEHDFALARGLFEQEFHDQPMFAVPLDHAPTYLAIVAEGYAPKVLGPYSLRESSEEPGHSRRGRQRIATEPASEDLDDAAPEPVDVALDHGFEYCVRVVDARGGPILGAEVTACLIVDQTSIRLPNPMRADDDGRAVFDALSDAPYEFEARMHGFRYPDDAVAARPSPEGSTTIALERGPASGIALDEEGRPVADALLLIAAELDEAANVMTTHLQDRIVLARSGPDGRFRLPALHDASTYLIRAEGPDGSLGFVQGARRGGGEIRATLRPKRVVRAVARAGAPGSRATVTIKRSVPTGFEVEDLGEGGRDHVGFSRSFRTAPDGRFEYAAWGSVDTELVVDGRTTPVPWPPPEEPFLIDASAETPTDRTIRLQFLAEQAIRPIRGTMTLHLDAPPPERAHQDVTRQVEIHDDQATFAAQASESFRYDSNAVPGYWTTPGRVTAGGSGDRFVDVELLAAGSIAGRVLNVDGSPAGSDVKVWAPFDSAWHYEGARYAPEGDRGSFRRRREGTIGAQGPTIENAATATADHDGRFALPAFPANRRSRLWVERGRYFMIGDEFQLAPGEDRHDVAIHVPPKASATVRVVDPKGRPVSGARLTVSLRRSDALGREWVVGQTGADGLLVIDDLAKDQTGYTLTATFATDFQPINVPLTPGGPPLELKARRGAVLEGRVVEAVTGWPIPNLALFARPAEPYDDLEVRTDADGRFRISTLPEGPVRLSDRRNLNWLSPGSPVVQAGSSRPVLIRLIDLRDEDPQPRPVPEF